MSLSLDKKILDDQIVVALVGRLDTTTAPELEKTLDDIFTIGKALILDFEKLDYVSSAGLRVLLKAQKTTNGNLTIKNVNESIKEVFDITGFIDILTIV